LLYLLWIGVYNKCSTLGKTQKLPALLEDMCEWQEIKYAVVLANGYALVVGHYSGVILSAGKDNTF
jgi:hypothetical protein